MDLKDILSISGKPGLYKLVAQSRGGVIVESMADGKRFPVMASQNVSSLGDIAIYTYEDELPLVDIFKNIHEKQEGKKAPSHKESAAVITAYFGEVVPNYDVERVYASDMKKVLSWYNLLHKYGVLDFTEEAEPTEEKVEATTEDKEEA